MVLILAGIAIAAYLTYVHYEGLSPVCTTGGCERVQASSYSEIGPIPVALLGLIGYVVILVSLFVRGDIGRALTFMLTLIGFAFSLYLTYLEVFVIDAICQWSSASAVVMAALFVTRRSGCCVSQGPADLLQGDHPGQVARRRRPPRGHRAGAARCWRAGPRAAPRS